MKLCNQCMDENDDSAKFCKRCRAPFESAGATTCPRGHIIDPTWTECPYCRAEAGSSEIAAPPARSKTVDERVGVAPPPPPPPSLSGGGQRRKTVYASPQVADAEKAAPAARRVVGVLVTYTWKKEGQVFPVCEGRNLIGRGPECEICVPDDPSLSNVNSHITFRKSFVLGDMVSMSGTDLNGEPVEDKFVPLPNYSKIRTGSTQWTFIVVEPAAAAAGEGPV